MYFFAPDKEVKKHARGKLLRWALKFSKPHYVVEHIRGPKNVWADMLSCWEVIASGVATSRRLELHMAIWPSIAALKTIQDSTTPPAVAVPDELGLYKLDGRIWVPPTATALIQRLWIIAHCGQQGRRG
ncbi:hypothetical protein PHMEG_0006247 [Phytophthora megakarya]|uniref:Reverse transcriptase RNase H-like domain-containing protein n=1 Tax=Phytophthora megakarya TaxID=4795 RepID=A0A225WPP6_9STRA|nr:hypothetical protein PHMEG_0006247 [Phytophthora megakarya]